MDISSILILKLFFDSEKGLISLSINIYFLVIALFFIIIACWIFKVLRINNFFYKRIIPVKLKFKTSGAEIEYQIVRNYQNIEIAYKIYIELVTRKAAIPIDIEKDVIIEVYDSWYTIFKTTRTELKSLKGELIKENQTSHELIRLLTDILNNGLRPHLTEYQAKFRKWYSEELDKDAKSDKPKSPQEIQKKYDNYEKLVESIHEVNLLLIEYSKQLQKIIKGD